MKDALAHSDSAAALKATSAPKRSRWFLIFVVFGRGPHYRVWILSLTLAALALMNACERKRQTPEATQATTDQHKPEANQTRITSLNATCNDIHSQVGSFVESERTINSVNDDILGPALKGDWTTAQSIAQKSMQGLKQSQIFMLGFTKRYKETLLPSEIGQDNKHILEAYMQYLSADADFQEVRAEALIKFANGVGLQTFRLLGEANNHVAKLEEKYGSQFQEATTAACLDQLSPK